MERLISITLITIYLFSGQINGWLFTKNIFEVCYDSLGCFSSLFPYTNTPATLPKDPAVIGTRFLHVTRDTMAGDYEEIGKHTDTKLFDCKSFRHDRPTKMIIHGWIHTVDEAWVQEMIEELLKHADYNIILVDWRGGSEDLNYMQTAANIRIVGVQVANLLRALQTHCDLDLSDVHIIGHSLGAHTAGYAGENLKGVGRITGLDPAGPLFEGRDPAVRLDPDDAMFVDVIHTDGEHLFNLGFGLKAAAGNVDFYPNGGMDQPGCPSTYLAQLGLLFKGNFDMAQNIGCSHMRAVELFTESINNKCLFTSLPCSTINNRPEETGTACNGDCAVMGLPSNATTPRGKYFLRTKSTSPYCFH